MKQYNPNEIEKKWQNIWEEKGVFQAEDQSDKPKLYPLVEFPYPSGKGLHVGHPRPYTALDIVARKRRLQDYNVLFPMGWDAFGLPTENFAIQNKMHPREVTIQNIARFKKQLQALGFSFDWSKEIDTTDPEYYKWTQWIFIQMFKKGLAYKKEFPINWCPNCKVGLANEEVVNGGCERCGNEVVKKIKNQWMLKITAYADRLIDDLDDVDYIERVKTQQKNWIGRSYGCEVDFKIEGTDESLKVFTMRADTLFGATYMVIAPEHSIINTLKDKIKNGTALDNYKEAAAKKSDIERTELDKEKTGVEIEGIRAINPVTGKSIPIFISDYVLSGYGTGAIMAVPAHDTRDYAFAKAFDLPIIEVVSGGDIGKEAYTDNEKGLLVNSDFLDGLTVPVAIERMSEFLEGKGIGKKTTNYKLRDWVFSRQRYWGEPIPLVYCEKCGWVPAPEESLPVELPEVETYEPTDNGESPLALMDDWVNTACPICGGVAKRETDTMPQWAGSSWYFIRYIDSQNKEAMASEEKIEYWLPVDWYNGGMEHTTLHLLYSRFWHKFLYDIGVVNTKEPYQKRTSHGMILGENNEKMSKSRGNVINPDDIVNEFGADTLRMYEMFIGDFEKSVPWSQNGVKGCRRFLDRVWKMASNLTEGETYSKEMEVKINQTIKKVSEDFETLKFNTGISALMELTNEFLHRGTINRKEMETFLILLNPVAPHITEELWVELGYPAMLNQQQWPTFDESKTLEDEVQLPIQINGKLRSTISINRNSTVEEAKEIAFKEEGVLRHLEGKTIVKEIYIPGKIFNLVVK
ncbi:leucine--tRNA ligase [endosymbiont 'TC1' of Trimyema compressum]|uniref:leucine--tRNA ligase n=1 Tax=endosymbiont 'TC1' of Trimyema compressum TaxID=243899 RepID=UPI0007F06BC0|nr:leucine--tRNA ligase [endosymbiont 'TC1' of Trimyema compressum]AMP20792.1 leucine--tRNA ligase [endosymbiont 'TC1' of Trimyema compressum]